MSLRDKSPCPFLSMLLNNKLIPDKQISNKQIMSAIRKLDIFDSAMLFVIESGLLKQVLNADGILSDIKDIYIFEHDISLSRLDRYQGDSISFNRKHFSKLKSKSIDGIYLTLDNIVEFRKELLRRSRKKNPNLVFGPKELLVCSGEDAFLVTLFSDKTGKIRLDWLEYFFENANFPIEIGYKMRRVSTIDFIVYTLIQYVKLYK